MLQKLKTELKNLKYSSHTIALSKNTQIRVKKHVPLQVLKDFSV